MFIQFVIAMAIAVFAIFIAILLGEYGPWYLSWFLGTGFMVLVAAAGGIFYEAQEDADKAAAGDEPDLAEIVVAPEPDPTAVRA